MLRHESDLLHVIHHEFALKGRAPCSCVYSCVCLPCCPVSTINFFSRRCCDVREVQVPQDERGMQKRGTVTMKDAQEQQVYVNA